MGKEIGIDLGTTNTVVSYKNKKGHFRHIKYDGKDVIPSVVYFKSKEEYLIGQRAKKRMEANRNRAGIANFKTDLGDGNKCYEIVAENGDEFKLRPREIAIKFLNKLVCEIETRLQKEFGVEDGCIDKAVITVPAKFNDVERRKTLQAALEAGLSSVQLAYEPTAAAIAYEVDTGTNSESEAILVYDFGGGTFDVSVIKRFSGSFREIATNGDKNLGGNVLTRKIEEHILWRIKEDYDFDMPIDENDYDKDLGITEIDLHKNLVTIHQQANNIKEDLSSFIETPPYDIPLILPEKGNIIYPISLTREDFESLIRKEIDKTINITMKTVEMAREEGIDAIKCLVLAGGSSNIPIIKERLESCLKEFDVIYGDSNDGISTLISRGAAILAQRLDETLTTKQKTNAQLGVKVTDDVVYNKFEMIIPENAPLPCSGKKTFRLMKDGQREFSVEYYEYDVNNYPNNKRVHDDGYSMVDRLIIDNLPDGLKRSETIIEIEFRVQEDGRVEVNAAIKDLEGKNIAEKALKIRKESEKDLINE